MNLETIRKSRGFSQCDLSKLSGVSQAHISKLELGIRNATIPVAQKLATALGVSILELIGDDIPKTLPKTG